MNTCESEESGVAVLAQAPSAPKYAISARTFHVRFVTADSVCAAIDAGGIQCHHPSSIDANAYRLDDGKKTEIGYAQFCAVCFHSKLRKVFDIPDDAIVDMPHRL